MRSIFQGSLPVAFLSTLRSCAVINHWLRVPESWPWELTGASGSRGSHAIWPVACAEQQAPLLSGAGPARGCVGQDWGPHLWSCIVGWLLDQPVAPDLLLEPEQLDVWLPEFCLQLHSPEDNWHRAFGNAGFISQCVCSTSKSGHSQGKGRALRTSRYSLRRALGIVETLFLSWAAQQPRA